MSETLRESIEVWLATRDDLIGADGAPTRDMRLITELGHRVLVNMSDPCTGKRGTRGIVVRQFDGIACCEGFTWKQVEKARMAALHRSYARAAYEEFKAKADARRGAA